MALFILAGCGTLPPQAPLPVSSALAPSPDSALVKIAVASTPGPDLSGFRLMPLGVYSLEARMQLAQRAQRSLDLQYYTIENDTSGRLMFRALRDAALRGVRVRLLVDDLYTTHIDEALQALSSYPNVEVRLFNPFCCARGSNLPTRFAASIFDIGRLNHRMHNKLFIADGVMAVAGGRNIGDQYFQRGVVQNFVDMDAFIVGAVVKDLANIFDEYWNSPVVRPIESISKPVGTVDERQQRFHDLVTEQTPDRPVDPPTVDVLGYGPLSEDLLEGRLGLIWAKARAFADPPGKLLLKSRDDAIRSSVTRDVMMSIWAAQSELVITSPYLIPGPLGIQTIEDLRRGDVKITILTNSLAATDVPLVHIGYARYRYRMLKAGVDLYELSPVLTQRGLRLGAFGTSHGSLHAKTVVIDRRRVFIGSMNLDPRSESQNTELGIFADSPELAAEVLRVVNISKLQSAYKVRVNPTGPGLQWLTMDDDGEVILDSEPESSTWLRLQNMFLGFFVPEQLL
ncbi:MAG: phospholipase D/Transphosphatidylase [Rhizobacter sp.]|nr:phospholipase D/Transphosphatidylase [Rhizobacter sp.]